MRLAILSSGSSGNATIIQTSSTTILLDAGITCAQVRRRLDTIGLEGTMPNAILLTHAHGDHTSGLEVICGKHPGLTCYANVLTANALYGKEIPFLIFEDGAPFELGDILVTPIPVPHDAPGTVGYRLESNGKALLYLSDLGCIGPAVRAHAEQVDLIAVESNHDPRLLQASARPDFLKQRIAGRFGHLSNGDAAEFVRSCASPRLRHLVLLHLSHACNSPELARETMSSCLREINRPDITLTIATPETPTPIIQL